MIHRLLLLFCITASLSRGSAISMAQESFDTMVNAWPNNPDSPGAGTSKQDWRYDDQTINGDTTDTKKASALGLEKPSTSSSVIDSGSSALSDDLDKIKCPFFRRHKTCCDGDSHHCFAGMCAWIDDCISYIREATVCASSGHVYCCFSIVPLITTAYGCTHAYRYKILIPDDIPTMDVEKGVQGPG